MRWLRWAHAWAGAAAALVLVLIGVTGAALTLREPLTELRLPALADTQPVSSSAALAADLETIDRLAGAEGWSSVVFASPGRPWHHVRFPGHHEAYLAPGAAQFADRFDPLTRPESLLFELHTALALGPAGEAAVGLFALTGFLLLVTGLIIWLWGPKRLRLSALDSRRAMIDAHNFIGVTVFAPLLLFVATGVMMNYSGTGKAVFTAVLGGDAPQPAPVYSGSGQTPDWGHAVATADAAFDGDRLTIAWPPSGGGPAGFRMKQAGEWHPNGRTRVLVDDDGALLYAYDAQAAATGERAWNAVYPWHSGRLNIWHRILAFLTGAALTASSAIGLIAFVRKHMRARSRRRARLAVADLSRSPG